MGRKPCCEKFGLKRGPWTVDEDQKLINFILNHGIQCWRLVPQLAGLMRCGKSCRLRWTNYLRPDLKKGALSEAEEDQIIQLHARLGNRLLMFFFPLIHVDNFQPLNQNHWNTRIKKRLRLLGVDPATHKPITQSDLSAGGPATEAEASEEQALKTSDVPPSINTTSHEELPADRKEIAFPEGELMWGRSSTEETMKSAADPSTSCRALFSLNDSSHDSSIVSGFQATTHLSW
ncbi:hypothetical protein Taro_036352, partial [Colocasia esculenta]|nr:hypothetical protein [Colocasia esculenta]